MRLEVGDLDALVLGEARVALLDAREHLGLAREHAAAAELGLDAHVVEEGRDRFPVAHGEAQAQGGQAVVEADDLGEAADDVGAELRAVGAPLALDARERHPQDRPLAPGLARLASRATDHVAHAVQDETRALRAISPRGIAGVLGELRLEPDAPVQAGALDPERELERQAGRERPAVAGLGRVEQCHDSSGSPGTARRR